MKGEHVHNDHFERELKKAAEQFEMQPSEEVWGDIQEGLSPSRRSAYLRWRGVAAAVLLALLGVAGYFMYASNESGNLSQSARIAGTPSQKLPKQDIRRKGVTKQEKEALPRKEEENTAIPINKDSNNSINREKSNKQASDGGVSQNEIQYNLAARDIDKRERQRKMSSKTGNRPSSTEHLDLTGRPPLSPLHQAVRKRLAIRKLTFSPELYYPEEMIQFLLSQNRGSLLTVHQADKKPGKVSFGAYFTTGVSYRTLKKRSTSGSQANALAQNTFVTESVRQERERQQSKQRPLEHKQDMGWNAGVSLGIPLSKKFILKTGVSVQQTEYRITGYKYISANQSVAFRRSQSDVLRTTPLTVTTSNENTGQEFLMMAAGERRGTSKEVGLKNQYLNAELPVLVGYRFGEPEKLTVTIMAGAGITYLLNANAVAYDAQLQHYYADREGDYLRNLNSNVIFNVNLGIPLSNHLQFEVGPSLQYQLFSSYKNNEPVAEFPYLIGLKTKIQLK